MINIKYTSHNFMNIQIISTENILILMTDRSFVPYGILSYN
jgi:hypothetical protein